MAERIRREIDNPLIFAGDSAVYVWMDRRETSVVRTGPFFPIEMQTLQSVTASALYGRGAGLDVAFRRAGSDYEVILR